MDPNDLTQTAPEQSQPVRPQLQLPPYIGRRPQSPSVFAFHMAVCGLAVFPPIVMAILSVRWVYTLPATVVSAIAWEYVSTAAVPPTVSGVWQITIAFLRVAAVGVGAAGIIVGVGMDVFLSLRGYLISKAARNNPGRQEQTHAWRDRARDMAKNRSNMRACMIVLASAAFAVVEVGLGIGIVRWFYGSAVVDVVTADPLRAGVCTFAGGIVPCLLALAWQTTKSTAGQPAENEALASAEGTEARAAETDADLAESKV